MRLRRVSYCAAVDHPRVSSPKISARRAEVRFIRRQETWAGQGDRCRTRPYRVKRHLGQLKRRRQRPSWATTSARASLHGRDSGRAPRAQVPRRTPALATLSLSGGGPRPRSRRPWRTRTRTRTSCSGTSATTRTTTCSVWVRSVIVKLQLRRLELWLEAEVAQELEQPGGWVLKLSAKLRPVAVIA